MKTPALFCVIFDYVAQRPLFYHGRHPQPGNECIKNEGENRHESRNFIQIETQEERGKKPDQKTGQVEEKYRH